MPIGLGHCRQLRWLVGAHVVLAAAPLLGLLLPFSMETLPILWALVSLPIGGLMTLSVWIGLGSTRLLWRVAIGLAAVFYVALFPFICDWAQFRASSPKSEQIMAYLEAVGPMVIVLFLFGSTFMLIGHWFKLARPESQRQALRTGRFQFSMLQIMLAMSVVAIVLSLLRATRQADRSTNSTSESFVMDAFMFVIFFVNTACAAFAALRVGKAGWNVCLVLVVSVLLGVATSLAMRYETMGWWLFVNSMFIVIIPTAMVSASLVVVRSCGYRLIRRSANDVVVA